MSHTTPATYLAWTIMSILLGAFLIMHLYKYDRFRCLRWHQPSSGPFKRIMTYTYLLTIPLFIAYSMGFTVIKYEMGWTFVEDFGIMPMPWEMWPQKYKSAIFPLSLIFAIAWSLEMVTHLEELCFWLFLLNAGRSQQDWFRSMYFRVWVAGSCMALLYMPLVAIFTRHDPWKCEASIFLSGSLGDLFLTMWFTPILWTFPSFISGLERENVDVNTIIRLTKFHELNSVRIVFRYIFVIPLVILGIDGVRPHQHINSSFFWTELFAILSGIGVVVSSGLTLMIFFPRSASNEYAVRQASLQRTSRHARTMHSHDVRSQNTIHSPISKGPMSDISDYPQPGILERDEQDRFMHTGSPVSMDKQPLDIEYAAPSTTYFSPNRRLASGAILQGGVTVSAAQELARGHPSLSTYITKFKSPIDWMDNDHGRQWR